MTAATQIRSLLGALPPKYDSLKEAFFAHETQPSITFLWDRLYDIETTDKRHVVESGASTMAGEAYYQHSKGRGRGRGRGKGAKGEIIGKSVGNDNCFRCGEADHWSRECPLKLSVCTRC